MTTTHFGFTSVDEAEKARHVRGVFDSVAPKYDLMNDLMSMGLHRAWKAYTVTVANLKEGDKALDIAGGTGILDQQERVGKARIVCRLGNANHLERVADEAGGADHAQIDRAAV